MENVGIFIVIWNILRPLVYFWPFGRVVVILATLTCTNVPVQQEIKFAVRA
jgi:hypothetical protein